MQEPELPDSLAPGTQRWVRQLSAEVADVAGVDAVVLAGSHARGRARQGSDIDLGVLRSEAAPLDLVELRDLCQRWHDGAAPPTVTSPGAWGPWVDGGAWLEIDGTRVDLLYRSFDLIERVWDEAQAGRFEHHWGQQAPYGFFSPTVLGEVRVCRGLYGALHRVNDWKRRTAVYPAALQAEVVQALLWQVEFNLSAFLPKYCTRGDAYGAAGCLSRAAHHLVLVLFSLNEQYPLNEKTTIDEIGEMAVAPSDFAARTRALLAAVGADPKALEKSRTHMVQLLREVRELAGPLYVPRL